PACGEITISTQAFFALDFEEKIISITDYRIVDKFSFHNGNFTIEVWVYVFTRTDLDEDEFIVLSYRHDFWELGLRGDGRFYGNLIFTP
ncbi:MAG: hypothetical protein Q9200_006955, partial [Gallowayella weberi]